MQKARKQITEAKNNKLKLMRHQAVYDFFSSTYTKPCTSVAPIRPASGNVLLRKDPWHSQSRVSKLVLARVTCCWAKTESTSISRCTHARSHKKAGCGFSCGHASPCQTPRQPLATALPPTKTEGACTRKKVRAGCALPTALRALAGSFANPAGLRSRV